MLKSLMFLAAMVAGSYAVTSEIIEPIRSSGEEVALIFIPGAAIKGEAYWKTARAVQEASNLRVWVALTGNYTLDEPNPLELPGAVEGAIKGLKSAGMTGDNYVGVAHSLGGVFLPSYARKSSLKAIVLLGSYLARGTKLRDYPKPVLTLSSELDGQTRITRIALNYEELLQDAQQSNNAIYRTPVINIRGSNHAQFASGPMPPSVVRNDIKADISDEEAHKRIGKHVGNFVAATFSETPAQIKEAKQEILKAFDDSEIRFGPLLHVKSLDVNGSYSPWALVAQAEFAGEFSVRAEINNNVIEGLPGFLKSKPSVNRVGNIAVINTTTLVDYEFNPLDISLSKESPKEIDIKMKSRDAINQTLQAPGSPVTSGRLDEGERAADMTCRALNELALETALKLSPAETRARYTKRGRPITFIDDVVYGTGFQWSMNPLQMSEDDKGLRVQSVALTTPITSPFFPGMHYCKVLSPYRAMEWIYVDSLRAHKP